MGESIIMVVLIGALLVFEFQQQASIKIKAKSSNLKYLIAFVAAILIIILFWSHSMQSNIKVVLIAVLFASVAFYNQGLGNDKVVTYGSLSKASDYGRYDQIIVEPVKKDTMVTFASKKGGSYSLMFTDNEESIQHFIRKRVPKTVKVLTGEEYQRQLTIKNRKHRSLESKQLEMIRNRPNRNKFVAIRKKS
ncbi:hypothetical protein [Companilactobacillus kimchii]|uniref:DUF4811 domain-containing protein n=2 Tax=Companilactobacillus kimchii TaxID=2801452 RepID=A0ABR5NUB3_9LACO|nr:hypothetical protein [Companilactobacillus kimchii]KAE9559769.1 hypothetical protein ATN91_09715 [Companilactobacillus kimchii]KRK52290.1 hypothetical protein FC97_GL000379 [Companilactobacillus kimchii DSM 13961 = JCM 10707]OWF31875.1 hypothetical protein LKACC12383_02610 [Companilactobacillus kimchii]GEO48579.1 hypothetical protein LKI01_25780 [Companilactobacillus paralimentarius]